VLAFDKGRDFAFSKDASEPCRNLSGHSCTIHRDLSSEGFAGCRAYDCLGAGNHVVQEVFAGRSWRQEPHLVGLMMEAFSAMREVHKRIDLLRAAETFELKPDDERMRTQFLEQLEYRRWCQDELAAFHSGLALDIDIFILTLKTYLPAALADEIAL
jgi:hypothetical protein